MKLILIDGNAILHRAFHALPPLTTKRGDPINAVYGLISMLLRVIQDLEPTHLAVCFDEKEKTFRHKVYPSYQAQRPKMLEELSSQFGKARDVLSAMGIPIYSMPGYEADDVIGTIATQSKENVVIVTGDKDQLQLVNSKVKVYLPIVGLSSAKLMGDSEVLEKMGVPPKQIDDLKALIGDPSDNYPGVPGIGPKTAVSLLRTYGGLDYIYENLGKISPSIAKKLKDGKKSADLSKKLATIDRNVPIKFDQNEAGKWDIDNQKVLDLFSEFGFKTLTERVKKVGKMLDEGKQMPLI